MADVDDILMNAANTFSARKTVYGHNYLRVGAALAGMFPDGIVLRSEDDFNRFHILMLTFVKLSRYCVNWETGGHQDSIHDASIYCAMLEMIDGNIKGRRANEQS
jgi:hypothetical protein